MEPNVSAGQLLVAAPDLTDPNFDRTVVFLLDHDGSGSLGVVVNRPTELAVADVLAPWSGLSSSPDVVFSGGPVGVDGALALAAFDSVPAALGARPRGWRPVIGGIGLIDLDSDPQSLRGDLRALRIFAGYAGWGAGQLEAELHASAWLLSDVDADLIFCTPPDRMWEAAIRRLGADPAALQISRGVH